MEGVIFVSKVMDLCLTSKNPPEMIGCRMILLIGVDFVGLQSYMVESDCSG